MRKNKERLGFDCLSAYRNELFAFSIISIMIFHFFENFVDMSKLPEDKLIKSNCYIDLIGSIGVEIFILLSGLGLYFSLKNKFDIKSFYSKRFLRILVPYGIFGVVAWLVITIIDKGNFWDYIYDLSLLSFWTDGVKMLWYIAFILVLYLLFPLIFMIVDSRRSGLNTVIALAVTCLILFSCENVRTPGFRDIEIALWRIPIFIIGTYFGKLAYEKQKLKAWHYVIFVLFIMQRVFYSLLDLFLGAEKARGPLSAVYMFIDDYYRAFSTLYALGLVFLLVIIFRALNSGAVTKISSQISKITLELYMTHVTLRNISFRLEFPANEFWFYSIYIAISVAISIALNAASNKIIYIINCKPKKCKSKKLQSI